MSNGKKQPTLWEVAEVDEQGNILVRGGIKATRKTAIKWMMSNIGNYPDRRFALVEADDDAISYRDYISGNY